MTEAEKFSISEDGLSAARKRFDEERIVLATARAYGSAKVASQCEEAVRLAAVRYVTALRDHANAVLRVTP